MAQASAQTGRFWVHDGDARPGALTQHGDKVFDGSAAGGREWCTEHNGVRTGLVGEFDDLVVGGCRNRLAQARLSETPKEEYA